MDIDFAAWYKAVQDAIAALPTDAKTSATATRAQTFVKQFPTCLETFDAALKRVEDLRPFKDFQRHPNYLLRWLLAEWRDEERKQLRTSLDDIITHSTARVKASQRWRSGDGDWWAKYGYKNIDDLYDNYKSTPQLDAKIQTWFFQRFYGRDKDGYPVHYDLLPNSHDTSLLRDMTLRRVVNNEYTLRHREWVLNPPPLAVRKAGYVEPEGTLPDVTPDPANPRIGVTWIIDCRRLSIWQSSAIYKTAQAMIEASQEVTSQNYPEQGHRTLVLNLGLVFGSMYNLAIKVMPAQTQRTTKCSVGNEALKEQIDLADVPALFREPKPKVAGLTPAEEAKSGQFDRPPFMS